MKLSRYLLSRGLRLQRCFSGVGWDLIVAFWGRVETASQVGVPALSQPLKNFRKIKICLPDIETQKRIASVIEALNNKIETNQKINGNLLDQAQAFYYDMFISNANPEWPRGHLSDLISVRYGKDHKKLADGVFPVYGSGGIMRYVERPLYDKESVLIPRKWVLLFVRDYPTGWEDDECRWT